MRCKNVIVSTCRHIWNRRIRGTFLYINVTASRSSAKSSRGALRCSYRCSARLGDDGRLSEERGPTNRWTGATGSELLIKVIRFYHGACERAAARSTQPLYRYETFPHLARNRFRIGCLSGYRGAGHLQSRIANQE